MGLIRQLIYKLAKWILSYLTEDRNIVNSLIKAIKEDMPVIQYDNRVIDNDDIAYYSHTTLTLYKFEVRSLPVFLYYYTVFSKGKESGLSMTSGNTLLKIDGVTFEVNDIKKLTSTLNKCNRVDFAGFYNFDSFISEYNSITCNVDEIELVTKDIKSILDKK